MLPPNPILQNRYRIVRELGHGGMGTVYEGYKSARSLADLVFEYYCGSDSQNKVKGMSTTITIPTELEKKIAGRAAAEGKDVEEFALEALAHAAEAPSLRELFADLREQIQRSGLSEDELDARIEAAVGEVRNRRHA